MVHAAKVDRWVAAVFGGAALLVLAMGSTFLWLGLSTELLPISNAIGIASLDYAIGALLIGLLIGSYRIRYEITITELRIRCGPFTTRVPLDSIEEVFPTRNPLGAPAPSFDRLQIRYVIDGMRRFALISPRDKTAFVNDLATAAPWLQETGDERLRVVRS